MCSCRYHRSSECPRRGIAAAPAEPPAVVRSAASPSKRIEPAAPAVKEPPLPYAASANYFHSIRRLLADLKQDKNDAVSMGQIGLWYDTYARKIDMLAQSDVDSALIDYGGKVASDLHTRPTRSSRAESTPISASMQITPLNMTTVRYARPNYGGYSPRGYGYGSRRYGYHRGYNRYGYGGRYGGVIGTYYFQSRNLTSERLKVRADEKAKMAKSVAAMLADIDTSTAKMRQEMTAKYGPGF